MYVDDVPAGNQTQQSSVSAIKEPREKKLLQGIPKEQLIRADFIELEDASVAKTLGIRCHATSDSFFFCRWIFLCTQITPNRGFIPDSQTV